jgi:hypothetical protein
MISQKSVYEAYDKVLIQEQRIHESNNRRLTVIQNYLKEKHLTVSDGFRRMNKCRQALEALDRTGWARSFHQRMFHDNFMRACVRVFWKTEPPGKFAKEHTRILEVNGWDCLSQEVLVSTPRRYRVIMPFRPVREIFTIFTPMTPAVASYNLPLSWLAVTRGKPLFGLRVFTSGEAHPPESPIASWHVTYLIRGYRRGSVHFCWAILRVPLSSIFHEENLLNFLLTGLGRQSLSVCSLPRCYTVVQT